MALVNLQQGCGTPNLSRTNEEPLTPSETHPPIHYAPTKSTTTHIKEGGMDMVKPSRHKIPRDNLQPSEIALHSMLMALKLWPFSDSFCKMSPIDMDDLRTRASSYIQMEEMAIPQLPTTIITTNTLIERIGRRVGVKGQHKSRSYTIQRSVQRQRNYPSSQRWLAHEADKTNYYRYHRNYSHKSEGCIMLRDKIEEGSSPRRE
ncbi:hypothetical protein CR513_57454, partial [Mucuna pruriens]